MKAVLLFFALCFVLTGGIAIYMTQTSAPYEIARLREKKNYCETLRKEIEDIKKLRITNSIAEAIRDCQKEGAWPEEVKE